MAIAGAVGRDEPGNDLIAALRSKGADVKTIRRIRSFGTPVKTRILAGAPHSAPQQIVRVDRMHNPGSRLRIPWKALTQSIRAADAIILSDYGYGNIVPSLLARLVSAAEDKDIPLVVDSRFRMSEFSDVTSITPNITELEAAVGIADRQRCKIAAAGRDSACWQDQRLQSLLVTQGTVRHDAF